MNKKHLFRTLAFVLTLATVTSTMAQSKTSPNPSEGGESQPQGTPSLREGWGGYQGGFVQLSNCLLMPQFGMMELQDVEKKKW